MQESSYSRSRWRWCRDSFRDLLQTVCLIYLSRPFTLKSWHYVKFHILSSPIQQITFTYILNSYWARITTNFGLWNQTYLWNSTFEWLICPYYFRVTPIFKVSSVTGENLSLLRKFYFLLPSLTSKMEHEQLIQCPSEFQVSFILLLF